MKYEIKCHTDIFHYAEGDHKFVGLLSLESNREILDAYSDSGVIDVILERLAQSEYMDKDAILNDVKDLCNNRLTNINNDEIEEIITDGFTYFFVVEVNTGAPIIAIGADIVKSEKGYIVSYNENGRKIPIIEYDTEKTEDTEKESNTSFDTTTDTENHKNDCEKRGKTKRFAIKLIIVVGIACLLLGSYFLISISDVIRKDSTEISEEILQEAEDANIDYIDELETKGMLTIFCRKEETVKYAIFDSDDEINLKQINWDKEGIMLVEGREIIYPKRNCQIVLYSNRVSVGETSVKIDFDFCKFIEYSIKSGTNSNILKQLFRNNKEYPLTIDYGDGMEEVGTEINVDVFVERIKESLHIRRVEVYPYTNVKENIMSVSNSYYPPLKTIFCTENF